MTKTRMFTMSPLEARKLLESWGWIEDRHNGGHLVMIHHGLGEYPRRVQIAPPNRKTYYKAQSKGLQQAASYMNMELNEFLDGPKKERSLQDFKTEAENLIREAEEKMAAMSAAPNPVSVAPVEPEVDVMERREIRKGTGAGDKTGLVDALIGVLLSEARPMTTTEIAERFVDLEPQRVRNTLRQASERKNPKVVRVDQQTFVHAAVEGPWHPLAERRARRADRKMRDQILDVLAAAKGPLHTSQIAKILGVDDKGNVAQTCNRLAASRDRLPGSFLKHGPGVYEYKYRAKKVEVPEVDVPEPAVEEAPELTYFNEDGPVAPTAPVLISVPTVASVPVNGSSPEMYEKVAVITDGKILMRGDDGSLYIASLARLEA